MSRGGDFGLGKGVMEFGGDDTEFQKVADRVEKTIKVMGEDVPLSSLSPALRAAAEEMLKEAAAAEKTAKAVKAVGEVHQAAVSPLRSFASALVGKEILNNIGEGLVRVSRAAEEMATKFRLGQVTAGEMFEEIAKKLPLIGKFIESGRDIRELITGEKAYTEVVLANAKAQDERTAAVGRWLDAMKSLGRETEDLNKKLRADPGIVGDITGIITSGERAGEDLTPKLKERFQKQFDDIAAQRKILSQKLQDLERDVQLPSGAQEGDPVDVDRTSRFDAQIEQQRRQISALDEQAAKLRDSITNFENLSRQSIQQDTFGKIGEQAIKSLGKVSGQVDAVFRRIASGPLELQSETKRALDATESVYQKFFEKVTAFQLDFQRKLISGEQLKALSSKAFLDTAAKTIQDAISSKLSAIGAAGLQTFNFAPFLNVIEQTKSLFSDFGDARKTPTLTLPKDQGFQSRSLSLEGLNQSIQQAALSTGAGDIQKRQLDELQKGGRAQGAVLKAVQETNKILGGGRFGTARVG